MAAEGKSAPVRLPLEQVQALAAAAFVRVGMADGAARDAAQILTLAEAMGIPTHGLSRVQTYVQRIAAGGIEPDARPEIRASSAALRHINGGNGLGPAIAQIARIEGMMAARSSGIGAAFVAGGNHLGALAPYLLLAAEAGFAAIITTNTAPMLAPPGGRQARIGNNPLGIAIPGADGQHLLLDMALSVVARSRVRAALRDGKPLPDGWATDPQGRPTRDPAAAMSGLMRAIGGDKGASLALALDLLVAALSGSATSPEISAADRHPGAAQNIGQMFIFIDAGAMMGASVQQERLRDAAALITGSDALDPAHPVRLPGARAQACLADARRDGLAMDPALLAVLETLAGD